MKTKREQSSVSQSIFSFLGWLKNDKQSKDLIDGRKGWGGRDESFRRLSKTEFRKENFGQSQDYWTHFSTLPSSSTLKRGLLKHVSERVRDVSTDTKRTRPNPE